MDPHFLAEQVNALRWALLFNVFSLTKQVHGDRGFVCVSGCPDDVLGAQGRVTSEKYFGVGRLKRVVVEYGAIPLVEFNADVTLNPGAVVLLPNRHEDMVGLYKDIGFITGDVLQTAVLFDGRNTFKQYALQLAVFMNKLFRRPVVNDRDVFVYRFLFFPIAGFHHLERAADNDGYRFRA